MEFIKIIRERLGYSKYKMAQELGFNCGKDYACFENSKRAVNVEKLVKLWLFSGLSAQEFMELMQADIMRIKGRKEK